MCDTLCDWEGCRELATRGYRAHPDVATRKLCDWHLVTMCASQQPLSREDCWYWMGYSKTVVDDLLNRQWRLSLELNWYLSDEELRCYDTKKQTSYDARRVRLA